MESNSTVPSGRARICTLGLSRVTPVIRSSTMPPPFSNAARKRLPAGLLPLVGSSAVVRLSPPPHLMSLVPATRQGPSTRCRHQVHQMRRRRGASVHDISSVGAPCARRRPLSEQYPLNLGPDPGRPATRHPLNDQLVRSATNPAGWTSASARMSDPPIRGGDRGVGMPDLAIRTQALRGTTYRTRRGKRVVAVQGFDLEVPVGGVHGFLGPNGSGKTTSIRMLLGLVRADPHHDGVRPGRPGAPARRRRPGRRDRRVRRSSSHLQRPEEPQLLADAIGAPRGRVGEVLEETSLGERGKDKFKTYSLGMKQRLAIAATLLKEPELLIFDEPTNGLDPAGSGRSARPCAAWANRAGRSWSAATSWPRSNRSRTRLDHRPRPIACLRHGGGGDRRQMAGTVKVAVDSPLGDPAARRRPRPGS